MTFASGRTTLRLTPTSDQSIGRRQGPSPGAATGLQPRRHPGRRPEAPGRPRPRPPDRHRACHLHRAISGLTVRCFQNDLPSRRLVSCICGQAGVNGHPGICGGLRLGMPVRPHTARRPPAWMGWSLRAAPGTRRLVRRGWRGPEPLLWQATARLKDDERLVVPVRSRPAGGGKAGGRGSGWACYAAVVTGWSITSRSGRPNSW
jgi:hypothetical protein